MKLLFWLAIPIFFLVLFFALPKPEDQPQTKPVPVTQREEPSPASDGESVTISIMPLSPLPGDPVKVNFNGLNSASKVKSLTFDDKPLAIFEEEGKLAALIGLDFHEEPGSYPLVLTLSNNQKIESSIEVRKRELISTDFDIPIQLGGNTPQAEHELTTTLSKDSTVLNSVTTQVSPLKLWSGQFQLPLEGSPVITDVYGYSRKTGSVSLSHLGTDFRAAEGTAVYAINSGKVAYTGTLRNFGKTVIIDHGLGLMTLYMHLSKINVVLGDRTEKGDPIAKSGSTGYSLGPHLHLSIRINGLSIDPQKFLELMGSK